MDTIILSGIYLCSLSNWKNGIGLIRGISEDTTGGPSSRESKAHCAWWLRDENAGPRRIAVISACLQQNEINRWHQPAYSPNINWSEFMYFHPLKGQLDEKIMSIKPFSDRLNTRFVRNKAAFARFQFLVRTAHRFPFKFQFSATKYSVRAW